MTGRLFFRLRRDVIDFFSVFFGGVPFFRSCLGWLNISLEEMVWCICIKICNSGVDLEMQLFFHASQNFSMPCKVLMSTLSEPS